MHPFVQEDDDMGIERRRLSVTKAVSDLVVDRAPPKVLFVPQEPL